MTSKNYPNVAEVRQRAREDWEHQQKQRKSRIEKISGWIDYWIIFFVLSFVLLSIPHTVKVFDMITPTFGKPAFIGLEVGLLYRSFRGKIARKRDEQLHLSLRLLGWLMFVVLIVANGAGSFIAIADSQQAIDGLSLAQLLDSWPQLPAQAQIALILVPLAAIMIPVGTIVGGEGLAALFLEVREEGNPLDEQWQEVAQDVEFLALRDAALALGHSPKTANKWAAQVVDMDAVSNSVPLSVRPDMSAERKGSDTVGHNTGQGYSKQMSAVDMANAYLDNHGDPGVTVREFAEMVGIGKTTAANVLRDYRASNNGHGQSADGAGR